MAMASLGLLVAFPQQADAQKFLNKIKEKAESKILSAIGLNTEQPAQQKEAEQEEQAVPKQPSATDRLPKLRQSRVVWDGEVRPSTAADHRALMNELPPLPSVEAMANPDENEKQAYSNKLYSLSLRAEELDDMYACSDDEMLGYREKMYKELEGVMGLTAEEMKKLEDDNIPEAERTRLEKKMTDHFLGGMDVNSLESAAAKNEARMAEIGAELEAYEKKEKKGQLTEADRARMQELTNEMMQMSMGMFSSFGGIMEKTSQIQDITTNMMKGFETQLNDFVARNQAIRQDEAGVVKSCDQIAAEFENELKAIYNQIWEEDDAEKVHALYDRADELMKNYRMRAAKIYRQGLVVRLENAKVLVAEAEQLYSSMAEDGTIPQCAAKRAALNVVIDCIDILESAYSHFPQPEVVPYKEKAIDLGLREGERILNGESGYTGSYATAGVGGFSGGSGAGMMEEDFLKNSSFLVYNEKEDCYYKLNNGVRTRLEGNGPFNYYVYQKRADTAYGTIQLRGGDRKAVYSRDGSLTLHDGTTCYPVAMMRNGEWLEFIAYGDKSDFVVCSYKL